MSSESFNTHSSNLDVKDQQRKISVLIVENDLHELQVIGNSLKAFGHHLLYATSSSQAFRIVSAKKPDIILLNAAIASANNYELLSLISGEFSITPVLIMASDATSDLIDAIQDYFWIDFIQKPLNIRKLLFRIYRHMENVVLQYKSKAKEMSEFPATKFRADATPAFKAKILLVEDNLLNQFYITAVLTRSGYHTMVAGTGKDAVAIAKSYKPDLILLDMVLPDMDGAVVFEQIKTSPHPAKVIVLSGYPEKEFRKAHPSLSVDAYLLKPIDPVELIRHLKKHISLLSENEKPPEKLFYDYSYVLEITQGSGVSFHEWLLKFIDSLKICQMHIDSFMEGTVDRIDPKVFHETLNYGVYYGAHELKEKVWKLIHEEKALPGLRVLILEIADEVKSLLKFYQRLSENKDLFL